MIVITGFVRSGTTAFGELLGSGQAAAYFGEVFHPLGYSDGPRAKSLRLRPKANFYRFVDEEMAPALRPGPPTAERMDAVWRSYVRYLQELAGARRPIIDIKYNSWGNLSPTWNEPSAPPHLLELVTRSQASIIHLRRHDLLAQALSAAVAERRGAWHRPVATTIDTPVFSADADRLSALMERSRAQTAIVDGWLQHTHHLDLIYEEVFSCDGQLEGSAGRQVSDFLGREYVEGLAPILQKTLVSYFDTIDNMAEICDRLSGGPWQPFAEKLLRNARATS